MSDSQLSARRATVEDLAALRELWTQSGAPSASFEKRVTDFQVVVDAHERPVGCVGLRIDSGSGLLYGESISLPSQEETIRGLLWHRVHSLASNHGLFKIWTLSTASFYQAKQFRDASAEEVKGMPESLRSTHEGWRVLILKEQTVETVSLDHEFEMFQSASRAERDRVISQARLFKWLAIIVGCIGLLIGLILAVVFFMKTARR